MGRTRYYSDKISLRQFKRSIPEILFKPLSSYAKFFPSHQQQFSKTRTCSNLIQNQPIHFFNTYSHLPPERVFNQQIHLQPTCKPVNVRPYRYPCFQKNEIEKQVPELLSAGLIRYSTSFFSLPVVLVKKKGPGDFVLIIVPYINRQGQFSYS